MKKIQEWIKQWMFIWMLFLVGAGFLTYQGEWKVYGEPLKKIGSYAFQTKEPLKQTGIVSEEGTQRNKEQLANGPSPQEADVLAQEERDILQSEQQDSTQKGLSEDGQPNEASGDAEGTEKSGQGISAGQSGKTDGSQAGTEGQTGKTDGCQVGAEGQPGKTDGSQAGTEGQTGKADGQAGAEGQTGKTDGSQAGAEGQTGKTDGSQAGEEGQTGKTDGSQAGAEGQTEQEEEPQEPEWYSVEEDYFEDVLFIGDSRTVGLYKYGGLEDKATFYASTGLTIYKLFEAKIVTVEGQREKITIEEALSEKQFKNIYLMVGINEMGTGTVESFTEAYQGAVEHLQELQPEAVIYIQGILKVTQKRSEKGDYINNEGIVARNDSLAELADRMGLPYLDFNPLVCDETEGLVPEWTTDGVHFKAKYIPLWKEFLQTHVAKQSLPEKE